MIRGILGAIWFAFDPFAKAKVKQLFEYLPKDQHQKNIELAIKSLPPHPFRKLVAKRCVACHGVGYLKRRLTDRGWKVAIMTMQTDYGMKPLPKGEIKKIHRYFTTLFALFPYEECTLEDIQFNECDMYNMTNDDQYSWE